MRERGWESEWMKCKELRRIEVFIINFLSKVFQGLLYIWSSEASRSSTTVLWPGSHKPDIYNLYMDDPKIQVWHMMQYSIPYLMFIFPRRGRNGVTSPWSAPYPTDLQRMLWWMVRSPSPSYLSPLSLLFSVHPTPLSLSLLLSPFPLSIHLLSLLTFLFVTLTLLLLVS